MPKSLKRNLRYWRMGYSRVLMINLPIRFRLTRIESPQATSQKETSQATWLLASSISSNRVSEGSYACICAHPKNMQYSCSHLH